MPWANNVDVYIYCACRIAGAEWCTINTETPHALLSPKLFSIHQSLSTLIAFLLLQSFSNVRYVPVRTVYT